MLLLEVDRKVEYIEGNLEMRQRLSRPHLLFPSSYLFPALSVLSSPGVCTVESGRGWAGGENISEKEEDREEDKEEERKGE